MKKIEKESLLSSERFLSNGLLTEKKIDEAIEQAIQKVDQNILKLGNLFPAPATSNQSYQSMKNDEWTNGFWTGVLWLSYEATGDNKYKELAEKHVDSFHQRLIDDVHLDHHDLGFLYVPSCVSAYKLTGNEKAKEAALWAADKLISRYQEKGEFIQAWGELGAKDNYRLIVDCLLNIPLLYWATEETGKQHYREMAEKHYTSTIHYAIRDDASAFHTFYFDPETGEPLEGKTRQGFSDDSSWARGQSWLVYGIALNHFYNEQPANINLFEAVTNYYLNRLPEDFISYWDLIFTDGSNQSRDSSATAIAICGMNLMDDYLPESNSHKLIYKYAQHAMMESLIDNYTDQKTDGISALINSGVYSWHSGKGVDEGNIWGDYFYLEALVRFKKKWKMYW
ncbi:glucuronyl hydrolase [Halolactibacillus alkaliphilus]|uniref:Glucuronyl hydrolase n=1 Tax=Halolactibacillus alkaliphilus TaxID=442899 RepID=A0A511WWP8_9BACI|nr:glycoside hydrolase family 88 protein [Halolactibacillus alkaliphilus]GEN55546.1 glucuronyl hydrolase [Halolactibacillus alkaliphilus]GGN64095.1 glucuronyl hydrolase [Halolactibacillus alkaliphilus]SFO61837.1 unsaturated chondroitin disaccharide hydrolase [Halolactibacillus alkaliphilus]